jgi:hypothetical protein
MLFLSFIHLLLCQISWCVMYLQTGGLSVIIHPFPGSAKRAQLRLTWAMISSARRRFPKCFRFHIVRGN